MGLEKLRLGRRSSSASGSGFQVVAYRPVRRVIMLALLALVVAGAAVLGFWLGMRTSDVDGVYVAALEARERAVETRLATLTRDLADVRLAQQVDAEAARSLRETISELHDRMAVLREEVTFYKSLMAPSSLERGLKIADFELGRADEENAYTYHLLLTQTQDRRGWVQGNVQVDVQGVRSGGGGTPVEVVLPLTELTQTDTYPLKFRFRYFQNLTGTVTLPDDFEPRAVVVTVIPGAGSAERAERRFDWVVRAG